MNQRQNYPLVSEVDKQAILDYLRLMKAEDYHQAHDVLEVVWLKIPKNSPIRDFYKGLIQAAAAFYLAKKKPELGRSRLFDSSVHYLEKYRFNAFGLNLDALIHKLSSF